MPFEYRKLKIDGPVLIVPKAFGDDRGFFVETYSKADFEKNGITGDYVQDNHSRSLVKGTIRGLHFQKDPAAQGKLVRCAKGEIFDVAVDLRPGSPTFGHHEAVLLSGENKHILYVPRGFAHGFMTTTQEVDVMYKTDNYYAPASEGGLIWDDLDVGIKWPLEPQLLSEKDKKWPTLKELKATLK